MRRFIAASALFICLSTPASAQNPGDWVLAQWRGGSQWFPGVVQARSGNQITIRYDDGSVETRPVNQIRPFDWRVGTQIECQWTDGSWYRATITGMAADGYNLTVLYEDGTSEHTNTGKCRVS